MARSKTVWLAVIIALCGFSARAQNPGYMGKKFTAGYGFYFNPAFTAALIDYGTNIINTQHEFFVESAVKKNIAIGLSMKLYRTTYNNTGSVTATPQGSSYSYDYYKPEGSYRIKCRNFAFYAKFFKTRYVAPWGKYFLLGITYNMYDATYDPDDMFITTKGYVSQTQQTLYFKNSDFGPTTQRFQYPDFMIGRGNSRIIKDKFVIDYGYNINLVAMTLVLFDAFDDSNKLLGNYIQKTSGMRVRGINRFNFFIKLGYLF